MYKFIKIYNIIIKTSPVNRRWNYFDSRFSVGIDALYVYRTFDYRLIFDGCIEFKNNKES